ncbi:MAG: opioid growth factor receptor-related protein [Verrucomicrobiota bacterium]
MEPISRLDAAARGPLVRFYLGEQPDSRGRFIREILSWTDAQLEDVHDYIQWLFPTRSPSPVNPEAPVLDDDQIRDFLYDDRLQGQVVVAFKRMMAFYGFEVLDRDDVRIARAPHWNVASRQWLTHGNHNFLRLTRILTCLRLVGLKTYSRALLEALTSVYQQEGECIGRKTMEFWQSAAR